MKKSLAYDLTYYDGIAFQNTTAKVVEFCENFEGDCIATKLVFHVADSMENILNSFIVAACNKANQATTITGLSSRIVYIEGDSICLTLEDDNNSNSDYWKSYNRKISVRLYGDADNIKIIRDWLVENIVESKIPSLKWEYLGEHGQEDQEVPIEDAKPIFPEFYPWIGGDVYEYFDRYLASESSILVLLGETGTAKTSFIRSMIWHANLNTVFTYEEKLLNSDGLFVGFMTEPRHNLLVVEDADLFLTSREHDGNKIMSKFLNVGDGLASLAKKKIIFTANITEPGRIDNALLRAGRCFDCMMFRPLTYAEAIVACNVADIPVPKTDKPYTLAELFAHKKGEKHTVIQTKVGFGR